MQEFKPSVKAAPPLFSPSTKAVKSSGFSPSVKAPKVETKSYRHPPIKKKARVADYAPGIKGFASVNDAAMFSAKFGLKDTLNGAIQLIPGKVGEANMERDWNRLEYAMEQYGAPVIAAYFGGLVADPIGLMIPISKLRIPAKIMKLGEKYLKAKDYAQVAVAGAVVGGVGYTPGEVGSDEWLKMKGLQTGIGAVAAPAMLGVGKGVANQWRGGKNARYGMNKHVEQIPAINRAQKNTMNATRSTPLGPKTLGERGWEKYSNSPTAIGASLGGAGGGFAAYNSDIGTDFTDKTLRDWFGDDEPRDWQKWVNGTLGTLLGGAGMRKAFKNKNVARFVIKGYGQTGTYISAKQARRGTERMIMEAHVLPLAAKLEKLSKTDRETLWKMVTQEGLDSPMSKKELSRLSPLMDEVNETVATLGQKLVAEGILNEKIWLKNKDKYLTRLYRDPGKPQAAVAGGGFGFIGTEIMSRGNKINVNLNDLEAGKYGIGGSRNKKGYKWEAWKDTIKGKGYTSWQRDRERFIAENQDQLDDLYKMAYSKYSSRLKIDLTDAHKANIRQEIKEWFLPEAWKKANRPAATVTIRRDWTKAERKEMGEVTDILDTFLATGKILAYDGATADMLKTLYRTDSSANANTLKRHTEYIERTQANKKKYGPLAGRYVSDDMLHDMMHFNGDKGINSLTRNKIFRVYRKFNSWWKGTKTVGNPAVHMGNFVSNIQHFDHAMAGNMSFKKKWGFLASAMKDLSVFGTRAGKTAHIDGSDLNEAMKRGLLDATLVSGELQDEGIHAMQRILSREATKIEKWTNSDIAAVSFAANYTRKLWDKTGGLAIKGASRAYSWEDNVFRFAFFRAESQRLMEMGLSKDASYDAAARKARSWFVDYADVPPALGWLRETGLPFLSYTYGIVPRLAETAMKHPMKVAKWAAIGHLANEAGWTMSDDSDREEIERLMEAQSTGFDSMLGIPGLSPTKIKNPDNLSKFFGKDQGFWDISRIYAGGDIFNGREGGIGQFKIFPGFAQPSFGAAGAVGWTMMSIDQFKGKEIPAGKKIEAFYRQFVPNVVGLGTDGGLIPDSYAQRKLRRSLSNQGETGVDNHTPLSASLASIGIKITPVSLSKLRGRTGIALKSDIRKLKSEIRNIGKAYSNGDYHSMLGRLYKDEKTIDKEAKKVMEKKIESVVRGIERLAKKYRLDTRGD